MYIQIPTGGLTLYPWQEDVFRAVRDDLNGFVCIHRRAGKDVTSMQIWLMRALQRVGTHIYLFPQQNQARKVIWEGMMFNGQRFIDLIPQSLIVKKNDARMTITLLNGSVLILGGSNNISAYIGSNPVTLIYSEFALQHPQVRQFLNPILVQNGGKEFIQSTPRGLNHMYELFELVKHNPAYHVQVLGVDDTTDNHGNRIITEAQIEESRAMGMSEEKIQQEWYCNWHIGNQGSYYTTEIYDLELRGGLRVIKPANNVPLQLACDLGGVDSTCFILFQVIGKDINILKVIVDSGKGMKYYLDEAEEYRRTIGCPWGNKFAPHDIAQRSQDWANAESRLLQARKAGWHFIMTPKLDVVDGIEAAKFALRFTNINVPECDQLVRALREYQRSFDEIKQMYAPKPLHNWASHYADAFRYLAINYNRLYNIEARTISYSSSL